MSPSPKTPDEKKLPDAENSSNDDLSHPPFHNQNEYIASTDESQNNSDVDDDDNNNNGAYGNFNGYCLLPQESDINQLEKLSDNIDEDDEFLRFVTLRVESSIDETKTPQLKPSPIHPIDTVWTTKIESESFPVDDEKANYIKTRMSEIKLPETSIPIWAQYCSEQDWQEKLRERIICRQTTFFLDEEQTKQ